MIVFYYPNHQKSHICRLSLVVNYFTFFLFNRCLFLKGFCQILLYREFNMLGKWVHTQLFMVSECERRPHIQCKRQRTYMAVQVKLVMFKIIAFSQKENSGLKFSKVRKSFLRKAILKAALMINQRNIQAKGLKQHHVETKVPLRPPKLS